MITTDLQKYIIKRQFIKNIHLLDKKQSFNENKQEPLKLKFESINDLEFELNVIAMPLDNINTYKIYPELLQKFKDNFKNNSSLYIT